MITQEEEEEELKKPKIVQYYLEQLTQKEVDKFYSYTDFNEKLQMKDPTAHIKFVSDDARPKVSGEDEMTPMYYKGKKLVSAQRVAYFMHHGVDPQRKRSIKLLCGQWNCVNPFHLDLKQPGETGD